MTPHLEAIFCDHTQIAPCCEPDCGHYSCPCGLFWDDGAFVAPYDPFFYDIDYDFGPAEQAG